MSVNINAVKGIFVNLGGFCKTNAPVIFAGAAVLGVVGTIVSAVKATHKADEVINECDESKELAFKDKAAMTWKYYIPTAVLGVGTIACIVGGTSVGVRRLAAATLAYEAANGKLNDAKEQFDKLLGETGTKMFDTTTAEKVDAEEVRNKHYISDPDNSGKMFWVVDPFGRRWITSEQKLLEARNYLNETINDVGSATLNEWYAWNEQEETTLGNSFRWDRVMHVFMNEGRVIDGIPHLYLDYSNLHCELDYNVS